MGSIQLLTVGNIQVLTVGNIKEPSQSDKLVWWFLFFILLTLSLITIFLPDDNSTGIFVVLHGTVKPVQT